MAEQYKNVYKKFFAKLVQSLPLIDAQFRAALVAKKMFCGDMLDQVHARRTNAEKNEHFLTNTIDTSLNIGITDPFIILLRVMKSFGSSTLKSLAEEIFTALLMVDTDLSYTQLTSDPVQPPIYTGG